MSTLRARLRRLPISPSRLGLLLALLLFLLLSGYQLGLPGLHYDEAKEAGVNAMELLTGAPVTPFREGAIRLGGVILPLMVQDYIGALNVYLALPFLALTGIGVPNLRFLSLALALLTLVLLERTVAEWEAGGAEGRRGGGEEARRRGGAEQVSASGIPSPASHLPSPASHLPPPGSRHLSSAPPRLRASAPPLAAVLLLAASPSFVFWSRQGIFVTNLTQPLTLLCVWMGLRWLRTGQDRALILSALAGGLALYAKLLAIWIVGPFALLAGGWWLWRRFGVKSGVGGGGDPLPRPTRGVWLAAIAAFAGGMLPLILFNVQTGGTLSSIGANLGQSYYGVDNWDLLTNLPVRLGQVVDTLEGDHFWYLGGLYANRLAPWLALVAVGVGLIRRPRIVLPPLLLLGLAVAASLFTVSDLFITHYALLHPFMVAVIALGLGPGTSKGTRFRLPAPRLLAFACVLLWLLGDLTATVRYHGALAHSGGLGDHSDATYHLAYYLRYGGLGAPVALDWGMDAPVRFLSQGTVRPMEIFGYGAVAAPDPDFAQRLHLFLPNPANVYLLRAPTVAVFQGRREIFFAQAADQGLMPRLEATFAQRDGQPLFEVWRVQGVE